MPPRESHHKKNDSYVPYDPFKKENPYSNKPETTKNDQRFAAGYSRPQYEEYKFFFVDNSVLISFL